MGKRILTEEQLQARREYNKQYRETHKEIERERQKRFREKNPDKQKEYNRRYLENNPGSRKEEYDRKLLREGKTRRPILSEEEKEARRLVRNERARIYAHERRIKNFVSVEKVCKYCGSPFMTEYKKSKTFCSEECKNKHDHYMSKLAEKRREGRITSLDRLDRDITLEKLYNRDGGICALCGKSCDYEDYVFQGAVFIAGNDYPSIDHIEPLSKGGSHTWDNVQLAHKICNSKKSNRELINF